MAGIPEHNEEVVNGIVIGPFYNRYGFFRNDNQLFKFMHFENDEHVIEWIKSNHPDEYKKGLEIRNYDW